VFDVKMENLYLGDYTRYPEVGDKRLKEGVEFVESWNGKANGRILGMIGTHASDTCDQGLHREARQEANRLGVGMHIHVAQSRREIEYIAQSQSGKGPAEYLADIGLLGPDVVVAHLTFATDRDLAAMRETRACYAHCPIIYPRRAVYPRLKAIRDQGITTGFGTDWMQNDPFEVMRNAVNSIRLTLGDPNYMPTSEALWLHTVGAAQTLRLDKEIGSLEVGKKADMILINLDRPHLQPFYGDYSSLVFYAKTSDIETSIIDGQVVMEKGRILGIDEDEIMNRIQRRIPGWQARVRQLSNEGL
jgi:5-methylthioadenosine/S-adenosylhomocysteine deaminase